MSEQEPTSWHLQGTSAVTFTRSDFKSDLSVRLVFPDRSFAVFQQAFSLEDEQIDEIAVFTGDLQVDLLRSFCDRTI